MSRSPQSQFESSFILYSWNGRLCIFQHLVVYVHFNLTSSISFTTIRPSTVPLHDEPVILTSRPMKGNIVLAAVSPLVFASSSS